MDAERKKRTWYFLGLVVAYLLLWGGFSLAALVASTLAGHSNAHVRATTVASAACFWFYWLICNNLKHQINSGNLPPAN